MNFVCLLIVVMKLVWLFELVMTLALLPVDSGDALCCLFSDSRN